MLLRVALQHWPVNAMTGLASSLHVIAVSYRIALHVAAVICMHAMAMPVGLKAPQKREQLPTPDKSRCFVPTMEIAKAANVYM